MHRILVFTLLVCTLLGGACAGKQDPNVILVATEAGYPPFESVDK